MDYLVFLGGQIANGLILGGAYSLVAIGLTLVFGVLGVVNLAQGQLLMIGAFAGLFAMQNAAGLGGGLLFAALVAGALGVLMERLALRPLPTGIDPHIPMVSTIGAGLVIQEVAARVFSARQQPYPTPDFLSGSLELGPVRIDGINLFILALTITLTAALSFCLTRTKFGVAVRAVSENPTITDLMGISRRSVTALVFGTSSALAGIAGVLVGMYFNNLSPFIGVSLGLKGIAAVILGGLGSVSGAVIAGFAVGITEVVAVSFIDASWRDAIGFGVIIVVLLLRPNGMFGKRLVEKV